MGGASGGGGSGSGAAAAARTALWRAVHLHLLPVVERCLSDVHQRAAATSSTTTRPPAEPQQPPAPSAPSPAPDEALAPALALVCQVSAADSDTP